MIELMVVGGALILGLAVALVIACQKAIKLEERVADLEAAAPPVVVPSWKGLVRSVIRVKRPEAVGLILTETGEALLSEIDEYVPEGRLHGTHPIRAKNAL